MFYIGTEGILYPGIPGAEPGAGNRRKYDIGTKIIGQGFGRRELVVFQCIECF